MRGSQLARLRGWLLPNRPFPVEDLSSILRIRTESTDIFLCMPCRVPGILGWGRCVDSFGLNGLVFLVSIPCFLSPVVSAVDDGWWHASRVVETPLRLGWVSFFRVWRVVRLHGWRSTCYGGYETTQLALHLTTHHRGLPEDAFCHRLRFFLVFLLCLGSHAHFPLPSWFRLDPIPPSFLGRRGSSIGACKSDLGSRTTPIRTTPSLPWSLWEGEREGRGGGWFPPWLRSTPTVRGVVVQGVWRCGVWAYHDACQAQRRRCQRSNETKEVDKKKGW